MSETCDTSVFEFETLRRYGAKWAVLTAMAAEMVRKGIDIPRGVIERLRAAKGKIGACCSSADDIGCDLAQAESELFSQCDGLEQHESQYWCDLLAEAMQGNLDYRRTLGIPALEPVKCDRSVFEFDTLRRYGAKWAVLTSMAGEMVRKGINVPRGVIEGLRSAKGKIESGCSSADDIDCELAQAEGELFSQCDDLDQHESQYWCDLLAEAMQGSLDYRRILGIPALEPVKNDCRFLGCSCS